MNSVSQKLIVEVLRAALNFPAFYAKCPWDFILQPLLDCLKSKKKNVLLAGLGSLKQMLENQEQAISRCVPRLLNLCFIEQ